MNVTFYFNAIYLFGRHVPICLTGHDAFMYMLTPHVLSGVSETEFLTYKGTFGEKLSGMLDAEAGSVNVTLEGRGSSKLQSCFGKLKKEELDVKKLLHDSSDRC